MKLSLHIAIALCAILCTQCVSPLDPDTPRQYGPIDDPVVVPSRPIPAWFSMSGRLDSRPYWPKFTSQVEHTSSCRIDTAKEHPAVWIDVSYTRDSSFIPPNQVNRLKISRIWIYVDSLSLLGNKTHITLDGDPFAEQNGAAFEVHWFNSRGRIQKSILVTGRQTQNDTLSLSNTRLNLGPGAINRKILDGRFSSDIMVTENPNRPEPHPYSAIVKIWPK